MKHFFIKTISVFLIMWFPCFISLPIYAQEEELNEELFTEEEEGQPLFQEDEEEGQPLFQEEDIVEDTPIETEISDSLSIDEIMEQPINESPEDTEKKSKVQNAILEGIQISSDSGETAQEKIVTCYFIFRDKPTSYFYEAKQKEKEIVFEFNDVIVGPSPIPQAKETPIQGFRISSMKIDANKEVVGLNPEWHDILKVTFFFDAIPEITVRDEYSVISFAFKWSTNPEMVKNYVKREGMKKPLLFTIIGGSIVVTGTVAGLVLLTSPEDETSPVLPLSIHDLPVHPDQ